MDRGAWWATAHEVAKSWTQLNTHTHTSIYDKNEVILYMLVYNLVLSTQQYPMKMFHINEYR